MKKRIYIAAALATVALVGCQKELAPVVGSEETNNAGLELRPEIGSPSLTIGVADTKVVRDETGAGIDWKFAEADQVGAMLTGRLVPGHNSNAIIGAYVKAYVPGLTNPATWTYSEYVKGVTKDLLGNGVRYAFSDTYKDAACKIKNDGEEFYDIAAQKFNPGQVVPTNEIWSNYPYSQEGKGNFKTPATLVEGHYVFYTPYDVNHTLRGPLVVTLPVKQDVSSEFKAIEDFYAGKDPVLLAMKYLPSKETSAVNVEMEPIFAYPQFTIVNNYEGYLFDGKNKATSGTFLSTEAEAKEYTMTIKEIELYTGGEDEVSLTDPSNYYFAYQREVSMKNLYNVNDGGTWHKSSEYETAKTSSIASLGTQMYCSLDYPFTRAEQADVEFEGRLAAPVAKKPHRIVLNFGENGRELKPGDDYQFYAVIPAEDYTQRGLFARILVEIEGEEYYILTNEVDENGAYDADATVVGMASEKGDYPGHATISKNGLSTATDYRFADRYDHASDKIVLVRGQRWPVAEVNGDKTAKSFKGDLMKIDLVGGLAQVAVAKKGKVTDGGIKDNAAFAEYLDKVHRDANVVEVADASQVTGNANFYFAKENTVIINAEFVNTLAAKLPEGSLKLSTNLPIANDVTVKKESNTEFEFTAGTVKTKIQYTPDAVQSTTSTALHNGINLLSNSTGDLTAGNTVKGAVVFLEGTSQVNITATPGASGVISGVRVGPTSKLTVSIATNAWVTGEGTATIAVGGNITNTLNNIATIENNALAAFGGKASTVKYSCYGFGIDAIPASAKVTELTVNPTTANKGSLEINAAAVAVVKNLTNVNIVFGENVTGLTSKTHVTLTNVKSMKYVGTEEKIMWEISGDVPVNVFYKKGTVAFFDKINAGEGVTFVPQN